MDLVSIYIPTFNRLNLLCRAVESALCQSYGKVEILVVDDGSDDGTIEHMRDWSESDKRIKFIQKNGVPKGVQYSRNMALMNASGKYVTGLDDDDYFHPKRVERLVSVYREDFSGVASNYYCMGVKKTWRNSFVPRTITEESLYTLNSVGNQILTVREKMVEVGGYDEGLCASQDVDLWIRLIRKYGPIYRVSGCLYYFDMSHSGPRISISDNRKNGTVQFLEKYTQFMTPHQLRFRSRKLKTTTDVDLNSSFDHLFSYGFNIAIERIRTKLRVG